jgi:methylase of polypeptide subunit release factors
MKGVGRICRLTVAVTAAVIILLPGTAGARWRTANDTAFDARAVCKNGAKITVADYPYDPATEPQPPTDRTFSYDLVVTNPPFIPDPLDDPVPQAPPESVVFRKTLTLEYNPIQFTLAGQTETSYYAYSKRFRLVWTRRLSPGKRVAFDFFPDTADDVIHVLRVADCLI